MLKAYLLMVCEAGSERSIENILKEVKGISSVDVVYGEYDLIATVEVNDIKELDGVVSEMRKIKGILRTITLICD
ncbi:MAG: Lrp/AsnC ligand binding domain-containing protein [Thermoproteota archaeon]